MSERAYLDLLQELVDKADGDVRSDRTGVGTYSVFGRQIRFDLTKGFPLLTTKRVFWKGVVAELLWFISGSTSAYELPVEVQKWWTPWARADGSLGPIYGEQYRRSKWWFEVEPLLFDPPKVTKTPGLFAGVGVIGRTAKDRDQDPVELMLKDIWRDMLKRCYDENSKGYKSYGGKGVHVAPEWLNFDTFSADVKTLPGWNLKEVFPSDYSLDKDILYASNRYSKDTCLWASKAEQGYNTSTNRPFYATAPSGERYLFASVGEASRAFGLNVSAIHRCLNKKLRSHHGWTDFQYEAKKVMRFREVDQLKMVIANLKKNPNSRRHVINLWNTPAMEHAQLPCCHGSIIQFYVEDGKLSCHIYQRSADIFLGVPVNIASYALLTHLIARETGLEVGEFVHTFGDVHLYANHVEAAREQLTRSPRAFPLVAVEPKPIFDVKIDDIELIDYNPHPSIKAKVAV